MKRWATADWHLGENRFEIMQRPFSDAQQMIDKMVENHNAVVGEDDMVYMLGDVCYQKTPQFLEQVSRFNGRKILFRGNHDRVFDDMQLSKYFDLIFPEGQCFSAALSIDGIELNLVHYPSLAVSDKFNLVGHIHGAWKFQLNCLNVGVDVHHFSPVNFDQIPFFFKAICEFYDDDVWCAYLPANSEFAGKRGKKGNYFSG